MTADELTADKKYVVRWCNLLRKSVGIGSTSRLARGIHGGGMDPITLVLWGAGVRWTVSEGDTVHLVGVRTEDAPAWRELREHVERCRSFEDAIVARFLRSWGAGLYPDLEPKPAAEPAAA